MKKAGFISIVVLLAVFAGSCNAESQNAAASGESSVEQKPTISEQGIEMDTIKTNKGDLKITAIGHGTLMFEFAGKVIHIDPVTREADYTKLPKADLILITHEHGDHLDTKAIDIIKKDNTQIILTKTCAAQVPGGIVMKNGDVNSIDGLEIEAVPAYNLDPATRFHPKGQGNGYVITFGDKKVYVAGDTENIPEMKNLKDIYIAFLPMNLPYTMSPEMAAEAAKVVKPKILYPYHFGQTDTSIIVGLLKDSGIEVRIRKLD
ncbi:MAG: MBL fold metallo-hydrolase [Sedimentisphaerales bacterium]|nr:MBL fold metallo-hydrolase [Sedimentisphaerales bacterium]